MPRLHQNKNQQIRQRLKSSHQQDGLGFIRRSLKPFLREERLVRKIEAQNIEKPNVSLASDLSHFEDYQDGANGKGSVIMGSATGLLGQWREDIINRGLKSPYVGRVLCPEAPYKKSPQWTKEKNRAFFAGVIASRRTVHLTTPIAAYSSANLEDKMSTNELLWLINNGYTPTVNSNYTSGISFLPPKEEQELNCIKLLHYDSLNPLGQTYKNEQEKLKAMIRSIEAQSTQVPSNAISLSRT